MNLIEARKLEQKIFESVVMELRDWRGCRYMFDAFDAEDEAEFKKGILEAIAHGIAEWGGT